MKILIIGSSGYIGSYLSKHLASLYYVQGCDIKATQFTHIQKNGRELTLEELTPFDVIIYLAGFSGRAMCDLYDFSRSYEENVVDIRTVAQKLTTKQVLLYASSASVVEGHENSVDETCVINETLLDKYAQSMFIREKELAQIPNLRCIGFRFGTVIGKSPIQRTDLVHLAMIRNALQTGFISVQNPSCRRGILSLEELKLSFKSVLKQIEKVQAFSIYHLCSFNTSIDEIAKEVAIQTGSSLQYKNEDNDNQFGGFHLNCDAFCNQFGTLFKATNKSLVSELISEFSKTNTDCRICKNKMELVLNLGNQPLANNYVDKPCEQPTFPLVLTRCKKCFHTQQDFTVPPEQMFSSYQYMSGTSKTLLNYFSWLADHIEKSIDTKEEKIVLELACNDGSQLDEFKKRGWKTFGVDPAQNIASIARDKGHDVCVAFWGSEKVDIPTPSIIIAQNVLAHVPDPIAFLQACNDIMDYDSTLYIQTSQCNMYEHGEFDTIYHEHLSFFTAASMKHAALLTGLIITDVEKTPIHGTSYLFTMKKLKSTNSECNKLENKHESNIEKLIKYETSFYKDEFFISYKQHIYYIQKWVQNITIEFKDKGYTLIAFGAAAKGMTLMNFFKISHHMTYIVDDAYIKQGKYTPNSNILIRHPSVLKDDSRKLAIIILAWNFYEEISTKIKEWCKNKESVLIIPYPQQIIRYLL